MDKAKNTNNLIKLYLTDKLQGKKLSEFEDRLINDTDLAKKTEYVRLILESYSEKKSDEESELIKSLYKEKQSQNNKTILSAEYTEKFNQKIDFYSSLRNSLDYKSEKSIKAKKVDFTKYKQAIFAIAAAIVIILMGAYYLKFVNSEIDNNGNSKSAEIINKDKTDNQVEITTDVVDRKDEIIAEEKVKKEIKNTQKRKEEIEKIVIPKEEKTILRELLEAYLVAKEENIDTTLLAIATAEELDLPESFTENAFLSLRAESTIRGYSIIKSPKKNEILKNPIELEFENTKGEISISILDNQRKVIYKKIVTNKSDITIEEKLTPGRYYCMIKVTSNEEKDQAINQFFVIEE